MARKKKTKITYDEFVKTNKKRQVTLDDFYKVIDNEIQLCDDSEELILFASAMFSAALTITSKWSGPEKTKFVLRMMMAEIDEMYPPGEDNVRQLPKPKKGGHI